MREPQLEDGAPWKQRYRAPIVEWTSLANKFPDRGLVCSNKSGVSQLYAWDVLSGELRQLTDAPTGKGSGVISDDGRYVYYMNDHQGDELGHYVRVPFEGGPIQDLTPSMPRYSSLSFAVDGASNLIGFMLASDGRFQLCLIPLNRAGALGLPHMVFESRHLTYGPVFSYGGGIAVVSSTERTGMQHFSMIAIRTTDGARVAELWDGPESSLTPVGFAPLPGDMRLLAMTSRTGTNRPLLWNPMTGERRDIPLAELDGDVEAVDWSPDGRAILLKHIHRAAQQLYVYELASGALTRLAHPGGTLWATYFTPSGEVFTQWCDATHPLQLIALPPDGRPLRTVLQAAEVPPGRPWRSVSFTSSDGTEVQAWLGVPEGDGPFPAIIETHGGPEWAMTELFSASAQAWLDHGCAYMSVNYRGSTTFGRAFQEQIWGKLGHWEVEDMAAARDWLVEQGIARPDQILLTGWSYGGYLTLQALGKRPELWAGGMAGIAIADWTIQYEDTAETLRGYQVALFGGTPEEKPEQYAASSPISYVDRVQAPVLVIQGRNDSRCPARPMELYEARMQALGKPIVVHWFDAGHGSLDVEQSIGHMELMLRFAARVLE